VAALACALAAPAWSGAQDLGALLPPEPPRSSVRDERPPWELRGTALEEWRLRTATPETDQRGRVTLNASAHHASDRLDLIGAADLWFFPGGPPPGTILPASTLGGRDPGIDVLALSVSWRPGAVFRELRAGRQETPIGPNGTFDGLTLRGGPAGVPLDLYAYGGRSVYFFSILPDDAQRWLAGAGATWRPLPQLRLDLDWRLDRADLPPSERPGSANGPVTEQGYGAAATWRPSEALRIRVAARGLDDSVALLSGAVSARLPLALDLQAFGAVQPVALHDVGEANGVYWATLGVSQPYARASLDLSRLWELGRVEVEAHLGWRLRRLLEGTETPFNRNLGGAWLLLVARDPGGTGLFATASLERIGSSASLDAEGLWAAGGTLGWAGGSLWTEVGSNYQRYRYTYYASAEEQVGVRSFHAEARWSPWKPLAFRVLYLVDRADRTYQSLTLGAAQSFE
jgi:hypothetical protein